MDSKTLKKAIAYAGLTKADLARRLGTTPQSLQNKMGRETLKEDDYKRIATLLGAQYVSYFVFPDGTQIAPETTLKQGETGSQAGQKQIESMALQLLEILETRTKGSEQQC